MMTTRIKARGISEYDMKNANVELYGLVRGFEDMYSTIVQERTAYTYEEVSLV
jgi:inward rectifier potassium channel